MVTCSSRLWGPILIGGGPVSIVLQHEGTQELYYDIIQIVYFVAPAFYLPLFAQFVSCYVYVLGEEYAMSNHFLQDKVLM